MRELLEKTRLEIKLKDSTQYVFLNDEDVSEEIRLPEISMMASAVSAVPMVREFLLDLQRDMAEKYNVIKDGRDIGTVVSLTRRLNIYSRKARIRAKRRYDELIAKGVNTTFDDVLTDLNTRDKNDSERAIAPLKRADDTVLLDTCDI